MTRILVVQTAFLGDVVLTTPLLRALRRAQSEAKISVVATPIGVAALKCCPHVDELLLLDKRSAGLRNTLRLARSLRRQRFDIAIAAQRSFRTGLMMRFCGAAQRVGFAGAGGAWAYTRRVPWDGGAHAVYRYLALAACNGVEVASCDPRPELVPTVDDRDAVERLLSSAGVTSSDPLLAIAPGSVWGTKRWTLEGYVEVVRAAFRRGLRTVLVGSTQERGLCDEIAARAGGRSIVCAGSTTVGEMVALLARSRALVTNDSGPGHVASAVGTPVVAVFGPTVPSFGYAPYGDSNRVVQLEGLPCRPCHRHGPQRCPLVHHRCMRDLEPQRVLVALDEILTR